MNVRELVPEPSYCEAFKRNRLRYIPDESGCYVLATFSGIVLYIGLTNNIRRRMGEHLDNPEKTGETVFGKAVLFHWTTGKNTNQIERTWLNIHVQHEGVYPTLNKIYSPTST
jgi:excinuclease UvrABC nuclease subunit